MAALVQWCTVPLHVALLFVVAAAVIDVAVQWIPNTFSAAAGGGVLLASLHAGLTGQQALNGALCAAIVFLLYLELGVHGWIGGGDVKFAPVPAFILGAVHPMLACWWLVTTIALQGVFSVGARTFRLPAGLPHLPAMALCFLAASSLAAAF
ncbi:prepilin peptidase [Curtobacterium sp. MCBD17_040]|uniref:prepilin peptidase n=1 Tax=Curtobacterium sp. MCBD17_040 TaxID=2175674 RepID=UPI0024DFF49E|nr:prepilin peptidase [Curtobacterium sp. MCBD17_040]WIB65647.1 prepilin peptidase [Curtobacterium sp. MCBD17_040]